MKQPQIETIQKESNEFRLFGVRSGCSRFRKDLFSVPFFDENDDVIFVEIFAL
jgi:hypothetical protein